MNGLGIKHSATSNLLSLVGKSYRVVCLKVGLTVCVVLCIGRYMVMVFTWLFLSDKMKPKTYFRNFRSISGISNEISMLKK